MRHVAGLAALEAVEPGLPFPADAIRIDQILLVQVFDEGGIGAELRGLPELLEETVHVGFFYQLYEIRICACMAVQQAIQNYTPQAR